MGRVGRHYLAHPVTPRVLIRGLLVGLVMAGIFGMHVLTVDDSVSGHGAVPMISATGHDNGMATPDPGAAVDARAMTQPRVAGGAASAMGAADLLLPADPGSGMDHMAMAACILFLVAGAAALVLALLRYRRTGGSTGFGRLGRAALTDLRRRGPPGRYRPRVALCVIRV